MLKTHEDFGTNGQYVLFRPTTLYELILNGILFIIRILAYDFSESLHNVVHRRYRSSVPYGNSIT